MAGCFWRWNPWKVRRWMSGTGGGGHPWRPFKVAKTPVEPRELPPRLAGLFRQLPSHEFHEMDATTGRLREYSEDFGDEARRVLLRRV